MIDPRTVKVNAKKWSGFEFFIFDPNFEFDTKIAKPEDFVKRVKINCYGCLAAPGYPSLYKCRERDSVVNVRRRQSEVYATFEECLAENSEGFTEKWISEVRKNIERDYKYYENQVALNRRFAKESMDRINAFIAMTGAK